MTADDDTRRYLILSRIIDIIDAGETPPTPGRMMVDQSDEAERR